MSMGTVDRILGHAPTIEGSQIIKDREVILFGLIREIGGLIVSKNYGFC